MKMKKESWIWAGGSGKLLEKIYYQRNGKTVVRNAPGSYNKIPTEKQAAARLRFLEAHRFAQGIIADPVKKALYEQRAGKSYTAYAKAVSDYLLGNV